MKTMLALGLLVSSSLAFVEANPSLATMLTPDGGITEGASGSFDPTGFRMSNDLGGEPLFVRNETVSGDPIPFSNDFVWSPLGDGLGYRVLAIAVSDSNVYAGGWFTEAGGNPANHIALWDGTSWSPLGDGVNDDVYAVAVSGSDLYVGGDFTEAGGNPANYIARWGWPTGTEPSLEEVIPGGTVTLQASPNPMTTGANLSFQNTATSQIILEIYDISGHLVRAQNLGTLPVGSHTHYWDGRDEKGSVLASGVYFVKISSTEIQVSTSVVLVR